MNDLLDLIFPDEWDGATRLAVSASVGVCLTTLVYLGLGFWHRRALHRTLDIGRWATTGYLVGIIVFFANRAYDIVEAGESTATWRLQAANLLLLLNSLVALIVAVFDPYETDIGRRTPDRHPGERITDQDPRASLIVRQEVERLRRTRGKEGPI